MVRIEGTVTVTLSDGSKRNFDVTSPGELIDLGHRLFKGSIYTTDHHRAFVDQCIGFSAEHTKDVNGLAILNAFSDWCESNKIKCPIGRNRLYEMLEETPGVVRTNPHNKTSFRGLKLLDFERVKPNIDDSDLI